MATISLDGFSKMEQMVVVRRMVDLYKFTHFTARMTGKLEAYHVEPCERCGAPAMNPNGIGFLGVNKAVLFELGLFEFVEFPPKFDITAWGEYCCSACFAPES